MYSEDSNQHVELSDKKVRIVFGSIESLDENGEDSPGYWVVLVGNDRKKKMFSNFMLVV